MVLKTFLIFWSKVFVWKYATFHQQHKCKHPSAPKVGLPKVDIDKINKSEVLEEANNMCETILANTVIENYKIDILEGK